MDELAVLLRGLKVHAESYETWTSQVGLGLLYVNSNSVRQIPKIEQRIST